MDKIDPRIQKAFETGQPSLKVVLVCGDECESVATQLSEAGIAIDTGARSLGILGATITSDHLPTLEATESVQSVEPDEDVSTN